MPEQTNDLKMRAEITPSTTVYCCSWIPLDNRYHNTLYFGSVQEQINYFRSKVRFSFDGLTYQRVNTNAIRVQMNAEQLMQCNYIFFQNSAYGSKWFYAFITETNYVNDITTEIVYELDVMQTWFFDFVLEQSFVEREHTASDNYFQFIKEEKLETGPYTWGRSVYSMNFYPISVAVMTPTDKNGKQPVYESDDPDTLRPSGGEYSGTWSACNIFFFDTTKDFLDYMKKINNEGQSDSVVSVYTVPKPFVRLKPLQGYLGDVTINTPLKTTVPVWLGDFNGYRPKNRKLYCYPYNFLVADAVEDQKTYRYEFFNIFGDQTADILFNEYCTVTPNPCAVSIPYKYEGIGHGAEYERALDFSNSITLSKFPLIGYVIDSYKAWVAQNSNSIAVDVLGRALNGAVSGAAGGMLVGGPTGAATGALLGAANSFFPQVTGLLSESMRQAKLPDKAVGATTGDIAAMTTSRRFIYRNRHITYEYAKQIDDYFTMYGYKICELKIPNINVRPNYTFTKTAGCNIHGNVPAQYAKKICSIFDNGVTHWRNPNVVGDYSVPNGVVTKSQAKELKLDNTQVYQDDDYEEKVNEAIERSMKAYDECEKATRNQIEAYNL